MAVDTAPARTRKGSSKAPRRKRRTGGFGRWLRRWWWVFAVVPLVAILLALVALVYVYTRLDLPQTPPPLQTTYIYDRDGRLLTTLHASVDRTIVSLSEMPKPLRNAVIAVEDQDFYEHPGIDALGILRAAWTDIVRRKIVQGGSTITQQLVKNVYAGEYVEDPVTGAETYAVPPRTFGQKIKESLLAVKVERTFSKDEILAQYLNTVYFGRGAYGVQAAARTFFQKDARDLTISESALLAGMIRAPSFYDPVEYEPEAADRRNHVLDRMVAEGYLGASRAEAIKSAPVRVDPIELGLHFPRRLGYFLDYTRRELVRRYGEAQVFGGGLRVTTTLDADLQRVAEAAVANHLNDPGGPSAALVAIDPADGGVLAMYGGANFEKSQVNLATGHGGSGRQAGSAFKPFALVAAMEQRYSLDSRWSGPSTITIEDPTCYTNGAPWTLSNASDSESGTFTLASATVHSVNTVYAQLASAVTPAAIVDVAHRMGITSPLEPVCSITLGTQSVTPLEMTDAYATLAARGVWHRATPLGEVELPTGDVDLRAAGRGHQVVAANDADLVTHALQAVIRSGTGARASIGRPAAGKTGTAQNYWDAWFCGYTPQLAACVWVGYPQGQVPLVDIEGYSAVFGGTIPALIWRDFMLAALAGEPVLDFPGPSFEGYGQGPSSPVPSPTGPTAPTPATGTAPTGGVPTGPTGPTAPGATAPTGPTVPTGPTATGATGGGGPPAGGT